MFGIGFCTNSTAWFRRRAAGYAFTLLAAGLASCATGEKLELNRTFVTESREQVVAEMNLVAPMVTPAHLTECTAKLEAENFFGAKYKVVSVFKPNVLASCLAQHMATGLQLWRGSEKAVGYVSLMTKVAGVYGTGSPGKVRGCRFILVDGHVQFGGLLPEYTTYNDTCRRFSSVIDRSTNQAQSLNA